MSGSEITEIKKELRQLAKNLEVKIGENTKLTQEVLDKIGDRVSRLEIAEATRVGRESATKPVEAVNWTKIVLGILGVASAAISLALLLAQKVLT